MDNQLTMQKKRSLTTFSYFLFLIATICSLVVVDRVRRRNVSAPPSQLFLQIKESGLAAKLQSEDEETQFEAIEDLAWAIDVNPEDKQIARLTFGDELNVLSRSQNPKLESAANTLLKQLGAR